MKFNLANCISKNYFSQSISCIEFTVKSKLKNIIRSKKSIATDLKINIQSVNTKYFFYIA